MPPGLSQSPRSSVTSSAQSTTQVSERPWSGVEDLQFSLVSGTCSYGDMVEEGISGCLIFGLQYVTRDEDGYDHTFCFECLEILVSYL